MKKHIKIILRILSATVALLVGLIVVPQMQNHIEHTRIAHDEAIFAKIETAAVSIFSDPTTYDKFLKTSML